MLDLVLEKCLTKGKYVKYGFTHLYGIQIEKIVFLTKDKVNGLKKIVRTGSAGLLITRSQESYANPKKTLYTNQKSNYFKFLLMESLIEV